MNYKLKKPCDNCPFVKGTPMVLSHGRMQGIVDHLKNDFNTFPCHKTTVLTEDEEGNEDLTSGPKTQVCMGATAYTLKYHERLAVMARLALSAGELKIEDVEKNFDIIEEPRKWKTHR